MTDEERWAAVLSCDAMVTKQAGYVARKFHGGLEADDVRQMLLIDLFRAFAKWDPARCVASTFAAACLPGSVSQIVRNHTAARRYPYAKALSVPKSGSGRTVSADAKNDRFHDRRTVDPAAECERRDEAERVRLATAGPRMKIVRQRFGIGCDELSGAEIGRLEGVTASAINMAIVKRLRGVRALLGEGQECG